MTDPRRAAYLQQMQRLIAEHGLVIQGVGASQETPGFAYTVGLAGISEPEFILFGLPFGVCQDILNDIGLRVRRGEMTFAAGDTVHDLLGGGYPARLLQVTDSNTHLTLANRLYNAPERPPLPALQIAYTDAQHRWPWEPDSNVAALPLLGPIPEWTREITLPEK